MSNQIVLSDGNEVMETLLYSLSPSSRRIYEITYAGWAQFCDQFGISRYDMRAKNLIAFVEQPKDDGTPLSKSTKQNRVAHMRKLLEVLAAHYPDNPQIEKMYRQAKLIRIKRDKSAPDSKQEKHALTPQQVFEAFRVFDEPTRLHKRNRALLAILFYGGLRREEAALLRWSDIDLENEMLVVRHGKGDKTRTIPLLGGIEYLREWRTVIPEREFMFPGFRRGDKLREDVPISTDGIYTIIKQVADALDIETLSPHDARRTLITDLLKRGASVSDAQFIAGHSAPSTTLGYAVLKDADEVKGRVKGKLGY